MSTPQVLAQIGYERTRQDAKWGEQNHPDGTGPDVEILPGWPARDAASDARNTCQRYAEMGIVTWRDIFGEEACEALAESDPARLRAELIQVAALAVNWIEAIDRRTATEAGVPRCDHRPDHCWGCPGGCASCRCHDDQHP